MTSNLNFFLLILFYFNRLCFAQLNVQSLIYDAIFNKKPEILLPGGTYKIDNPLMIAAGNKLTLRGSSTTPTKLLFDNPINSNKNFAILIQGSIDVSLVNIEIDFDPLPFTQGRVTRIDPNKKWFDVAIHNGYSKDQARFGFNCYIHVHDSATKRFKQEGDMAYTDRTETTSEGLRVYLQNSNTDYPNIQVNDLVSIGQPGFTCAISLFNTRNTLIDGVKIFSAPGCGVLENGGGGTVVNNLKILRGTRPDMATEDRLISINRDGLHLNGPNGGTVVKNSFIEFCGDDAVNIRSPFPVVTSVSGNTIKNSIPHTNFDAGANLYVYDYSNFQLKDTVKVNQHQIGLDTAVIDRVQNVKVGDLIVSPEHTQNFKILNNTFQDVDARAIVATGRNVYIEGNQIHRTTMGGIWAGAEFGYYDEGGFVENMFIRWNTLSECASTLRGRRSNTALLGCISIVNQAFPNEQSSYKFRLRNVNRNVIIQENTVTKPGLAALFLDGVTNVSVCKNSFFNDNNLYFNNAGSIFGIDCRYSIVIHDSSTIKIYQNWVIVGKYTLQMRSTTDSDNVTDPINNPC